MIPGEVICDVARSFRGVPYLHQGRTRQGMDCLGLLVATATECGFPPEGIPMVYGLEPEPRQLLEGLDQYLLRLKTQDALPGDILLVRLTITRGHPRLTAPQHLVVLLEDDQCIHAARDAGSVIQHPLASDWRQVPFRAYRYPFRTAAHG